LFNVLKAFSRFRLWRIDAAREKLETALKELVCARFHNRPGAGIWGKATLASQGAGHRATAKRSESISSRAAVLGREKAPSSGGRGLRVHLAFLTFLPSKTIRGAAIWFRCKKGKAPPKRGEDYPGRKSR